MPSLALVAVMVLLGERLPAHTFVWTQERINEVAAVSLQIETDLRGLTVRLQPGESSTQHLRRLRVYRRAGALGCQVANFLLLRRPPDVSSPANLKTWSELRDAARILRQEAEQAQRHLNGLLQQSQVGEAAYLRAGDALRRFAAANQTVLSLLREARP